MSIFTDSLYFQFHLLAFYSQRSGRRCWHFQGKRAKKLHYFFRFVLMTVVGIIVVVQHLLITYISFDFFFFHFSQSTHLDRQQVCKYYCGFQSAFNNNGNYFCGREGGGGWRTQTQILMDFLRFVIFACPHKILLTRRIDKFFNDCFQE